MKPNFAAISYVAAANFVTVVPYAQAKEPDPIYIQLEDHTLLRVNQERNHLVFARTSTGYGQASTQIAGVGANVPVSNVYTRLNRFEVMVLIDNDWRKIFREALAQKEIGHDVVPGILILNTLESLDFVSYEAPTPLDHPHFPNEGNMPVISLPLTEDVASFPLPVLKSDLWKVAIDPVCDEGHRDQRVKGKLLSILCDIDPTKEPPERQPVYMKLNDGTLLKISQRDWSDQNHIVTFAKSASGYGEAGVSLRLAGGSIPVANIYTSITPDEVLAYFQGDWEPVYMAALWQDRIVDFSIDPILVAQQLRPHSTHPGGRVKEVESENGGGYWLCGPYVKFKDTIQRVYHYNEPGTTDFPHKTFIVSIDGTQEKITERARSR